MKIGNFNISWKHMVEDGRTICSVYQDDKLLNAGIANLSENDQYDRRIGRKVSLTRALKGTALSKAERTVVWSGLRSQGVKIKN